jgi:hypothetical protein
MINIGIGVSWAKSLYSVANNIIANFRARVLSYPNSIFEAGPCLDATLEELNAVGLLDDASLIVTPNAYNEGVLYDVIPNTPLGDMNVVRATTATRVNSAGLIEVVPRNLFTYSEQFDNAVWTKVRATITANSVNSPTGTLTADTFTCTTTGTDGTILRQTTTLTDERTTSIFVKPNTSNYFLIHRDFGSGVVFDLTNGTIKQSSGATGTIINVGDGWYRCSATFSASGLSLFIAGNSSMTVTSWASTINQSLFIWGAQLESGATATEYFPTTTRLNIPRIDYTNGSCPSILVEPQRTNLLLRSQEFGTSPWAFGGVLDTISANSIISPDGTQNADTFVCGYTGYSSIYQSATTTLGTLYTFSVFAKKGNQNKLSIELRGADTTPNIVFDLNNGTILSGSGGTITSVGNGWYKCTLTKLSNSTSTLIIIGRGLTGSIGDTFNLYGAQLEEGSYPTSYIPTTSASVTRNADVISKTGISSLIGQTEGTVFVDINVDLSYTQADMRFINVSDGTSTNWWFIGTNVSNQIRFYYKTGATTYVSQLITLTSGRHKLAFAYKSNDYVAYVDGTQVHSLTSLIVGATSQVDLGNNFAGGNVSKQFINSVQLYKTRLTNSEITSLTTL